LEPELITVVKLKLVVSLFPRNNLLQILLVALVQKKILNVISITSLTKIRRSVYLYYPNVFLKENVRIKIHTKEVQVIVKFQKTNVILINQTQ